MEDLNKQKDASKGEPLQHSEAPPPESLSHPDGKFGEAGSFAPLTAEYLLERGYCCGNGCKNCPYDYKAVPEPRRSQLLEKRKNINSNELHE